MSKYFDFIALNEKFTYYEEWFILIVFVVFVYWWANKK